MDINIEGLDKAELLLALYAHAPISSTYRWLSGMFSEPEPSLEKAREVIQNCHNTNCYFLETINLGSGAKSLKVGLRGPTTNFNFYDNICQEEGAGENIVKTLREQNNAKSAAKAEEAPSSPKKKARFSDEEPKKRIIFYDELGRIKPIAVKDENLRKEMVARLQEDHDRYRRR